MTALDEVEEETVPNGPYVRLSARLKSIYDFVFVADDEDGWMG